ncbi:penicillin-binding transpeptidase domain-containing protein [Ralstonia syzygii]|uniref:penicillin-binding transpeptidase domain-containing protein n=1 Tax=Ralstonia syzygii TaxID=28097 RepID=UPI0018D0D76D|nr:penicillin-binding transpeptidase domain-containing protein [Ralstonia syzygii]
MTKLRLTAAGALLAVLASFAHARPLCTLVADAATGQPIVQEGRCGERVTPASTFKIALSLMGYDAGFLKDEHAPTLAFKPGDPDWGGAPGTSSPDGTWDQAHAYGWFVGWVTNGTKTYVFAHLLQDARIEPRPAGGRARDAVLDALPAMLARGHG